jgi:glyoxylase-like metal-dependent hydrolase (beta-lactamase superfamily II)
MRINVKQLFDYDTWSYTYILWDNKSCKAIIIDPVLEQISRDLDLIKKLELNLLYIFETHVHADHVTAASALKHKTTAKICYGSKAGVQGADILFKDGEKINFESHEIIIHHTPGHTSGCVSYYIDGYIFTGDTLFIEGTGRTDFQGGSSSSTYDSVRGKIFSYPDDTIVYPAHNYNGFLMSTIGHEKKFNPNVGDGILKEDFLSNEKLKKRSYPKKFDIAVPRNMNCGRADN